MKNEEKSFLGLIPAALFLGACSNTDSSTISCDTVEDCPSSTSAVYICKNNECVKQSSSSGGSETSGNYEEVKMNKYCDLAYECEDGTGFEFKCVDKSCVKLVPKEAEPEDVDAKSCKTVLDCKDDSGVKYDCINNRCKKATSSGGNERDPEEGKEDVKPGRTCNIPVDCDDGSGAEFKCENKQCVKVTTTEPSQPEDPVEAEPYCGDGKIDSSRGEVCDGSNLNGHSCKSLDKGYYAGTLSCSKTCLEFDESKCEECDPFDSYSHACGEGKTCKERHCVLVSCGNGKLDAGEICDGTDLGGKTCADLDGFGSGELKCSGTCFFDTSSCQLDTGIKTCADDSECGVGQKCVNEKCKSIQLECDSMDQVNNKCPNGKVCVNNQCVAPSCGDKIKNQESEECDGSDFGSKKCSDFEGFSSGTLTCSSSCKIETTKCNADGEEDECSKDSECGSGEKCDSGKCVAKTEGSSEPSAAHLVISQLYAGGGTDGASYKSKYLQILNATGETVELKGWSIQYAAADSGKFSKICTITTDKKLLNNRTLMVELYKGDKGEAELPRVEYSCKDNSTEVQIAQEKGIVVLTSTDSKLTSTEELTKESYVDAVGYGSAVWHEGSAAAPKLSKTTELVRKGGGCTDTDDNAADFETRAPEPPAGTLPVTCK